MSMPVAADKYREAIELYKNTDLTLGEISKRCGVTRNGLSAYIYRCQRDLMLKRNRLSGDPQKTIRKNNGQRPETRKKYREAIEACDSEDYIEFNISQIARIFHLTGTALANQLRTHYPDIIPRREEERRKRGIADNIHRGVRKESTDIYQEAIQMLRDTDYTIKKVAELCHVSFSGLRQHIIFYHKNIAELRGVKRRNGKEKPKIGSVAGNGKIREMSKEIKQRYALGVELYRTTSLPITEISKRIGVNVNTFRHHLKTWHKQLMFERRGAEMPTDASDRESFGDTKRYRKSTAEKYAEAIELLKTTDTTVESISKKFGFIPEVFRAYLKEHEPDLFESLGMMTLPNGKLVLKRSYEKYREAIEAYATTSESLKSIASRCGLIYNSFGGFIRRNMPELIQRHEIVVANSIRQEEISRKSAKNETLKAPLPLH